jgi:hypothetical protein
MYLDHTSDVTPAAPAATGRVHRQAERIAFDMLVRYAWRARRATAMLKDLTRFGARIEGIPGLSKGDLLTLLLPDLQPIEATVAWAEGHSAGLSFGAAVPAGCYDNLVRNFATGRPQRAPTGVSALSRAA